MKLSEIPQFTQGATYAVDIGWPHLLKWYQLQVEDSGFDPDPDFQRAHVWTEQQQQRYVEFILRGGRSGRDILTNHPGWHQSSCTGPYVLVDGKQRLTAVMKFLRDELVVFDQWRMCDFEDKAYMRVYCSFKWHVNELKTRAQVLQWYVELNDGGTQHTPEEIDRVKELLILEKQHG